MSKVSNMAINKMRKQTKSFANSMVNESDKMRKQSIKNSKALIEADTKSKKSKRNNKITTENKEVQVIKMHPSLVILFWVSIIFGSIITLLGY